MSGTELKRKLFIKTFLKNNRNIIYPLILIIVFASSYNYVFDKKPDKSGDNYNYINYASSILEGNGYASPYTPKHKPTNWFPPGYSSLLALVMLFFGKNIIAFKIINGLFLISSILLFYFLILKLTKNTLFAFSISLILLLNWGLLMFSFIIMAEIPYLFFSVLVIYWISIMKDDNKYWKSKYFYLIITATVVVYYLKSLGIVLIGAITIFFLLNKKIKTAVGFLAGIFILYLPWLIRNTVYGIKGRYLGTIMVYSPWKAENEQINSFSEFIEKLYVNLHDTVILGFFEVLFPFIRLNAISETLLIMLGILVIIIVFFGALQVKKIRYLLILYFLGNIAVFMLWHTGNASRYVWTLAPFIAFCFYYGIYKIIILIIKPNKKKILNIISYIIIFSSILYIPNINEMHKLSKKDYSQGYKHYITLAEKVKQMNYNNSIITCRKPGMFHFYSGAYVTRYKFSKNEEIVLQNLVDNKVDFVVLEHLGLNSTSKFLIPAIAKYSGLFHEHIFIPEPNTFLLKFDRQKAKNILKVTSNN